MMSPYNFGLWLAITLCVTVAGAAGSAALPLKQQNLSDAANVEALVATAVAGDYTALEQIATRLKAQPRPARGNRTLARQLNDRGLAFWQRQRYTEAAASFREAFEADASDPEIRENLGYALLKAGEVAAAEPAILSALEIGPERGSAWGSLGLIYAKQGKHREAVAVILTAYRYAPDRKRVLDTYSRLAAKDDDPKVRALLTDVVARLSQQ